MAGAWDDDDDDDDDSFAGRCLLEFGYVVLWQSCL
jgi:hypothetical protein